MDGGDDGPHSCRGSKRLLCIGLEREEQARDEWLVLDLCGNGHRDPDGVVGRTICESHVRRLEPAEGDRRECCMATSTVKMSSNTER